jgi:hypothetical protein
MVSSTHTIDHLDGPASKKRRVDANDTQSLTNNREISVGITAYTTIEEPFSGVFKQKYADFLVNEITPDGTIARLGSVQVSGKDVTPKEPEETAKPAEARPEVCVSFPNKADDRSPMKTSWLFSNMLARILRSKF